MVLKQHHQQPISLSSVILASQCYNRWLEDIRQTIWDRTAFENEMIPSDEALLLHWKRSCWVIHSKQITTLWPLNQSHWCLNDSELTMVWDSESNITAVRRRVTSLLRGCKCTTGCTGLCGCRRKMIRCSVGCQCINCSNTEEVTKQTQRDEMAEIALEEESYSTDDEADATQDIIDQVLGREKEGKCYSQMRLTVVIWRIYNNHTWSSACPPKYCINCMPSPTWFVMYTCRLIVYIDFMSWYFIFWQISVYNTWAVVSLHTYLCHSSAPRCAHFSLLRGSPLCERPSNFAEGSPVKLTTTTTANLACTSILRLLSLHLCLRTLWSKFVIPGSDWRWSREGKVHL